MFLAIALLVVLKDFMVILELKNQILVTEQEEPVAVTEQTSPGKSGAATTTPAMPGSSEQAARPAIPETLPTDQAPPRQSPPRQQKRTSQGEAAMVLVPGGTFWMGISDDGVAQVIEGCKAELKKRAASCKGWVLSAQPRHQVTLDSFSLDPYEVTNQQFEQFVQSTGYLTTAEKEGTAFIWTNSQQEWQQT
ncbi:hypothetical protein YTPLAS72_17450 [Nitrospira sp.]|nr:hypothetical protein YTPLAS72_17450 [Nitrospira sp.]